MQPRLGRKNLIDVHKLLFSTTPTATTLIFFLKEMAAPHTGVESQLAKAERGRAGNWRGPVGTARLAGRVRSRHGDCTAPSFRRGRNSGPERSLASQAVPRLGAVNFCFR